MVSSADTHHMVHSDALRADWGGSFDLHEGVLLSEAQFFVLHLPDGCFVLG